MATKKVREKAVTAEAIRGKWLFENNVNAVCGIFTAGDVLLLVNEHGNLAVGKLFNNNRLSVSRNVMGWQEGLSAEVHDEGKTIFWRNGTKWSRPPSRDDYE